MQTRTLVILGGVIISVAVGAAIYLRPLQDDIRARAEAERQGIVASDATDVAVDDQVPDPALDLGAEDEVADEVAVATDPSATDPDPTPVREPEMIAEADANATPDETSVQPPDETLAALPDPIAPVVTDRRFEPDGGWLVSGVSEPDKPLAVLIDGEEIARVDVPGHGAFVATGFLGRSETPRIMTLVSDPEGEAMLAERSYILDASPPLEPDPVEVAALETADEASPSDPVADPVMEIEPVVTAEAATGGDAAADPISELLRDPEREPEPEIVVEAVTPDTSEPEIVTDVVEPEVAEVEQPIAPAVLSVSPEGVEVVQPAIFADTPPEVMSTVALDTISYDPAGEVELRGRAVGAGFVQVYVDNTPVSRLPVDAQGRWRGDLPDVDKGVYTLRIDEVDVDGTVVSRIETPFLREDPETVIDAMADQVDDPNFTIATRTVQPGATLWAIAEERYGAGVLYVNVFEANRDRIRDPDLIYPGQVFMLPEGEASEDDS